MHGMGPASLTLQLMQRQVRGRPHRMGAKAGQCDRPRVCACSLVTWGPEAEARGTPHEGRRQIRAWVRGRGLGTTAPMRAPCLGRLLLKNLVRVYSPEAGMRMPGSTRLSQGPRGGQAGSSRPAGRSPRSPAPVVPAVGPVAGDQPSACEAFPAIVPALQKKAWGG